MKYKVNMRCFQIILPALLLLSLPAGAAEESLESLYRQIDEAIEHSPEYVPPAQPLLCTPTPTGVQGTAHPRKCSNRRH